MAVLCFKHPRRVARDNTVRFQLHTLQLLPGPEWHSYAGARWWRYWKDWMAGCRCGMKGDPRFPGGAPSPVFLRNGHGRPAPVPVAPSGANGLGERWTAALQPLDSRVAEEKDQGNNTDSAAAAGKPKAASPRKPTFLQRKRWKAIQKARRKGMSLRAIERELAIHRATIKKYLAAESPPTRQAWDGPSTSSSDTMAA